LEHIASACTRRDSFGRPKSSALLSNSGRAGREEEESDGEGEEGQKIAVHSGRVGDHAIARARLSRAPRRLSLIRNIVSVAPTAAPSERWVMLLLRAPPSTPYYYYCYSQNGTRPKNQPRVESNEISRGDEEIRARARRAELLLHRNEK